MSTTSCPRCSGHVTLPVGVSNTATVRCPLCQAQYTLADALENMPPSLEVVDGADASSPDNWFDDVPAGAAGGAAAGLADLEQSRQGDAAGELPAEELEFTAEEADEADLEQPPGVLPVEPQAEADSGPQELEDQPLDLETGEMAAAPGGEELSADDGMAETLEFEESQGEEAEEELKLDFDAPATPADAQAETLEFDDAQFAETGDDAIDSEASDATVAGDDATLASHESEDLAFDAPPEAVAADQGGLQEFGDVQFEATGEGEDIPLDLPGESADVPAPEEDEPPTAGKNKKRDKKKRKAQAANGKPRSLVGTLAVVLLPLIIGAPLLVYGALWVMPDNDFAGLRGILPEAVLPARPQQRAALPPNTQPGGSESGQHTAARPPIPPTSGDNGEMPADEAPTLAPADEEPAASQDAADSPGETAAGEPAADAFNPFVPATEPEEAPENEKEMPEADAEAPPAADDPFTQPASPAAPAGDDDSDPFASDDEAPADETPQKAPDAAAADDQLKLPSSEDLPSSEPAPAEGEAPEAATPEKPAEESDPFAEPKADSPPAADDPFSDDSESPPADDPFSADSETTPAAEKPAEEAPAELPTPDEAAPAAERLGPREAAAVTEREIIEALNAVQTSGQQMAVAENAGDAAQLGKARANFYVNLFNMANAVTLGQLGPDGARLDPQLQNLEFMIRQQLAADPKRFDSLKVFSSRWFAYPKRPNNGIALAGTVENVVQAGKLYQIQVKPAADTTITVVSDKDPQLSSGDEMLALGSIVEQPAEQLAGYEGTEPAVVWSGITLKVSPDGQ